MLACLVELQPRLPAQAEVAVEHTAHALPTDQLQPLLFLLRQPLPMLPLQLSQPAVECVQLQTERVSLVLQLIRLELHALNLRLKLYAPAGRVDQVEILEGRLRLDALLHARVPHAHPQREACGQLRLGEEGGRLLQP